MRRIRLLLGPMMGSGLASVSSPAALTEATATHRPTAKGKPRTGPNEQRKLLLERRRRQRRARITDMLAKTEATRHTMTSVTDARDVVLAQLADQIFSKGHRHVATATNVGFVPDGNPATPLVALAGRGQVGKSSLLRALFRSATEVGRSNRVLRRDAMNFFNVGGVFLIADLPGFGGTSVPWSTVLQHAVLLRNFVRCQPSLKMLYYCMDVSYKHGVYIQDLDMLRFLSKEVPNFTIVLTKTEVIRDVGGGDGRDSSYPRLKEIREELLYNDIHHPVLVTSAFRMGGIDTLRYDMVMNCLHALPTERLTYTEAKRLSERLLSQKELSTVRQLPIPPTQLDDDLHEWQKELEAEHHLSPLSLPRSAEAPSVSVESSDPSSPAALSTVAATTSPTTKGRGEFDAHADSGVTDSLVEPSLPVATEDALIPGVEDDALTTFKEESLQLAYGRVVKKLGNPGLMRYVRETSPWRDPLLWPAHVVPTKHPKANILRHPDDPGNPYLFQPTFVAPRADLYFRRPNVGMRKASMKGRYEADRPMAFLAKEYTVPYFPDIVDVDMHPLPWTFLGSREAYYERSGGRQLGVRLSQYATEGTVIPLSDNPAPHLPALTQELRALEQKRYGTPIAMLRPPGMEGDEEEGEEKEANTPPPQLNETSSSSPFPSSSG